MLLPSDRCGNLEQYDVCERLQDSEYDTDIGYYT